MLFRNCAICHKPFQYSGFGPVFCPVCKKKDDEDFSAVSNYLDQNPGCSGPEIESATGVSVQTIMKWQREERLVTHKAINVGLTCERCEKPIYKGKLCDECKKLLATEFLSSYSSKKQDEISRRTL